MYKSQLPDALARYPIDYLLLCPSCEGHETTSCQTCSGKGSTSGSNIKRTITNHEDLSNTFPALNDLLKKAKIVPNIGLDPPVRHCEYCNGKGAVQKHCIVCDNRRQIPLFKLASTYAPETEILRKVISPIINCTDHEFDITTIETGTKLIIFFDAMIEDLAIHGTSRRLAELPHLETWKCEVDKCREAFKKSM